MGGWRFCAFKGKVSCATTILFVRMLTFRKITDNEIHELRLIQCYLMPDETALRELSEGVIEKLKLLTDAEFAELEFPLD